MATSIQVEKVTTRRDLLAFVKFPWRVYRGDPNWVPPLILERLDHLNPEKNPFYQHAQVALYLARRGREAVGTIAAFVDKAANRHLSQQVGGFGFFEVVEDYAVAEQLLDTALQWVKARGMTALRGPTSFTNNDTPGVLIDGADCPPVMLAAHTPPYYQTFGDLATFDERGYLRIVGRKKDMIIRGGQNIYPAEVEAYLTAHDQIREVAVVGVPAPLGGERVWAFVLMEEGAKLTSREILDYCRAGMEVYKVPDKVRFVEDFPRSASGKPQKFKLRERAIGGEQP